jgi:hypothetical protein
MGAFWRLHVAVTRRLTADRMATTCSGSYATCSWEKRSVVSPVAGVHLVAEEIPPLLRGRPVVAQAIGFDDQAQLWPVEVGSEAVDVRAGQRERQPGPAGQREEATLELRVGEGERPAVEDALEGRDARAVGHLGNAGSEGVGRDQVPLVRLVDRRLDVVARERRGQVDEGPERGGDADTAVGGDGHAHPAVNDDAVAAHGGDARGYMNLTPSLRPDLPEGSGTEVTESRIRSAAQDRRHPPAVAARVVAPDGVDTTPNRVQPPLRNSMRNRPPRPRRPSRPRPQLGCSTTCSSTS